MLFLLLFILFSHINKENNDGSIEIPNAGPEVRLCGVVISNLCDGNED